LTVDVHNVNYGEGGPILQKSRHINEYARFIHEVYGRRDAGASEEASRRALAEAIGWCVEHDVMRDFLIERGKEIVEMTIADFFAMDEINSAKEEGREKGREEGKEAGREETREEVAIDCIKMGLSESQTVRLSKLPLERIAEIKKRLRTVG
jgi:flagellar biosynthesis/type III secretory pathway protein FliH